MSLEGISRIYFIGIGGIGMSALARYFKAKGFEVAGYDKTPSPLIDELMAEHIPVHFEDLGSEIPEEYRDVEGTLVIFTPAVPKDFGELVFVQQNHQVIKRSEALGLLTQTSFGLGVAGTHGKTTTSTLLAFVLQNSRLKCSAFLGGISTNFGTNVLMEPNSPYVVVEADEFDRSFLRLSPFASIITAMDPDHLDIYGDEENFREGFQAYADKHIDQGFVVHRFGLPLKHNGFKTITYGVNDPEADVWASDLSYEAGQFSMSVHMGIQKWERVKLGLPGIHNAENALAVCAMAHELGLTEEVIRYGLEHFKGVKRRFEYHVRTEKLVYIDDYAHHPTELKALIDSVRLLYPDRKVSGVFQPHLFSRTRDFLTGFIRELSRLDEVILMPVYPARELPIPGIDSDMLVREIGERARLMTPEQVLEWAKTQDSGVKLTIGAGDIDRLVKPLREIWKNK